MKKENVEMIGVIRDYIINSLKKDDVSPAHEPLARLVLEYDNQESKYDECKRNKDQEIDIVFTVPNVKDFETLLEKMNDDSYFNKLIQSMSVVPNDINYSKHIH